MGHLELLPFLLVALQNGITNLKHRFEKETPTIWTSYTSSKYLPKSNENTCLQKKKKKPLYVNVCKFFVHNCPKSPTVRGSDKQIVITPYTEVPLHSKKKWTVNVTMWMDLRNIMLMERSQIQRLLLQNSIYMNIWKEQN